MRCPERPKQWNIDFRIAPEVLVRAQRTSPQVASGTVRALPDRNRDCHVFCHRREADTVPSAGSRTRTCLPPLKSDRRWTTRSGRPDNSARITILPRLRATRAPLITRPRQCLRIRTAMLFCQTAVIRDHLSQGSGQSSACHHRAALLEHRSRHELAIHRSDTGRASDRLGWKSRGSS